MSRGTRWFTAPEGARAGQVRVFVRGACLDAGVGPTGPEAERMLAGIEWANRGGRLHFSVTGPAKVLDLLARSFP